MEKILISFFCFVDEFTNSTFFINYQFPIILLFLSLFLLLLNINKFDEFFYGFYEYRVFYFFFISFALVCRICYFIYINNDYSVLSIELIFGNLFYMLSYILFLRNFHLFVVIPIIYFFVSFSIFEFFSEKYINFKIKLINKILSFISIFIVNFNKTNLFVILLFYYLKFCSKYEAFLGFKFLKVPFENILLPFIIIGILNLSFRFNLSFFYFYFLFVFILMFVFNSFFVLRLYFCIIFLNIKLIYDASLFNSFKFDIINDVYLQQLMNDIDPFPSDPTKPPVNSSIMPKSNPNPDPNLNTSIYNFGEKSKNSSKVLLNNKMLLKVQKFPYVKSIGLCLGFCYVGAQLYGTYTQKHIEDQRAELEKGRQELEKGRQELEKGRQELEKQKLAYKKAKLEEASKKGPWRFW